MIRSCEHLNPTSLTSSSGRLDQYSIEELHQMQDETYSSIKILSSHCLYFASKWSAELQATITEQIDAQLESKIKNNDEGDTTQLVNGAFALNANPEVSKHRDKKKRTNAEQSRLEQELEKLPGHCMLAKAYFDLRQYQQARHVLEKHRTKMLKCNPNAREPSFNLFLRCYAQYLDGERKKEESKMEANTDFEKAHASNPYLHELCKQLGARHREARLDSFGMFLLAMVCKQLNEIGRARKLLIASINQYPMNWSAWQLLAELLPISLSTSTSQNSKFISELLLKHSRLENHFMKQFFVLHMMVEQCEHLFEPRLTELFLLEVMNRFSSRNSNNWQWMLSQLALMYYNCNRFEDAIEVFQKKLLEEPHSIELLDIYSNMLYVTGRKKELSSLAHSCMEVKPYSAETCCVVGNYYSMYSMHEKAILYFERALRLNAHFLSAYVLMGHEYIELRNTPAAIQCYRRALDMSTTSSASDSGSGSDSESTIGRPDYRALYGLGQTYELMQMPSYAIYYFSRVCKLKPYDPCMWSALAQCYHNLGKRSLAIKCYERALGNHMQKHLQKDARVRSSVHDYGSNYLMVVLKLAQLYHGLNPSKSYLKYKTYVQSVDAFGKFPDGSMLSDEMGEALHRLAEYALSKQNNVECKQYAQRLYQQSAKFKSIAHKILKHCDAKSFGGEDVAIHRIGCGGNDMVLSD